MIKFEDYDPKKIEENKTSRLWEEIKRWKELKRRGILIIKFDTGKITDIQAQLPIK